MLSKLKCSLFRKSGGRDNGRENVESLIRQGRTVFDLETLRAATGNFDNDNKLGEGGFGTVYKGRTSDGREIAVKKLSLSVESGQAKRELIMEVKLLGKIQHRNLAKLLGCCVQGPERLLVYEYLPNGSLYTFLFDPQKRIELDWQKRYSIITGIVRGLLYLHEHSHLCIIHRNIKASNILLDDKLSPKIADFGLAKLFPEDETHLQTKLAGTYGYIAPEYVMEGKLSVKVDVYSFGVLLLEIVSGRKNTDFNLPQETQSLLEWAWRLHTQGHILDMIDPTLVGRCPLEQALRCIQIGLWCTQADAAIRPAMSAIMLMISSNSVTLPNLTKPALARVTHSQRSSTSSSSPGHPSSSKAYYASTSSAASNIPRQ